MNKETASAIISALKNANFAEIFTSAHDVQPEYFKDSETKYAVMFNVETDLIFMLPYATSENSWAKTATSQNPWICIGYLSAETVVGGDPIYEIQVYAKMHTQI